MDTFDASFLYNSERGTESVFDCFYAHIVDDRRHGDHQPSLRTNYVTPYCRRLLLHERSNEQEGSIQNSLTFRSLVRQNVGVEELFQWSIAIDIIEQYAMYLDTNDSKLAETIFNICSIGWFGSHCQYTFGLNVPLHSFGDHVVSFFENRKLYKNKLSIHTCYTHLPRCYRGPEPMCLDWREVCDGKIDCIDGNFGIDEKDCDELELSQCKVDEYRCHNGAQCVPIEFFRDGWSRTDCLDGTDEEEKFYTGNQLYLGYTLDCTTTMIFACEETTCRSSQYFSCGDGQCLSGKSAFNAIGRINTLCSGTSRDILYSRAVHLSAKQYPIDCYKLLFCQLVFYRILRADTFNQDDCFPINGMPTYNCTMQYLPFPLKPLLFGYFQPVYSVTRLINSRTRYVPPAYICHDRRRCQNLRPTASVFDDLDCYTFSAHVPMVETLESYVENDTAMCHSMGNIHRYPSESSLFHCRQSRKYISPHRLIDGIHDCYHGEDETYEDSCLLNDAQRFKCQSEDKCLSPMGIGLSLPHCIGREDLKVGYDEALIFPRLCTSFTEFDLQDNETDETNCEWWPCHTPYTRCDRKYHCANGIDELNCPNVHCRVDEYRCFTGENNYVCLPQQGIYEIPLNCSSDLSGICRTVFYSNSSNVHINDPYLSWKNKRCIRREDVCGEKGGDNQRDFCPLSEYFGVPECFESVPYTSANETWCNLETGHIIKRNPVFSTWNLGYSPAVTNQTPSPPIRSFTTVKAKKNAAMFNTSIELVEYCNRGIVIFEGKSLDKKCLCPPNYYGDRCQLQAQRVSLTLQIRATSPSSRMLALYEMFIYLIDDQNQIIHSYEIVNYLSQADCNTKYNRYLVYPSQPKDVDVRYSIRIDIYEKSSLDFYGSWHLPIPFSFLPVNRIAAQIRVPLEKPNLLPSCPIRCGIHGRCLSYANSQEPFCYCDAGYTGRFCNVTYQRTCASGSIDLNSSICLCAPDKFGSKCYLTHKFCQASKNPCQNQGKCIAMNDRMKKDAFVCLCPENYAGSYCERQATVIEIRFKADSRLSTIFAHFITAFEDRNHQQMISLRKIPFGRSSISFTTSELFHVLLVEYGDSYYLAVVRESSRLGEYIYTDLNQVNTCANASELLNSTVLSYTYLRRLKYYPMQCLQHPALQCFYDEQHMCICDKSRFSNCFKFNRRTSHLCHDQHYCKNNGKCIQDDVKCPTKSICACEECYYGSQCQLTTESFSISFDVLLGYHIKSRVSWSKQSLGVHTMASITAIMFVVGLLNGILCVLTFRKPSSTEVGCGIYLLADSIVSILAITIFAIKFGQLLVFQMRFITHHSFIYSCCKLTDALLKILVTYGDWLNACVALERALTIVEGVQFSPLKSRSFAKYITPTVLLLISASYMHDPVRRDLSYDADADRTWCTVTYSTTLKIYDRSINVFHVVTPFIINFISAFIVVAHVFKARSKIQRKPSHRPRFYAQIQRHKHLLISPIVLVLLAFPRLIILLMSRCMKPAHDSWLFFVAYYISFIPLLLICPVFILPSERYRKNFLDVIKNLRCRR